MSWSEDTRCLYCEGRLPLYRKITHGQFCSSAHRKAYWQEHELLAIERLQQSHSSLRSYQSLDVRQNTPQEAASDPGLGSLTQLRVAARPELETSLELPRVPSLDVNLGPIPDLGESPIAALEFLSLLAPEFHGVAGGSPELVAADPIEYEITLQPLQPSRVASGPGTNPFPKGQRMAVWSYLGPQALLGPQASGVQKAAGAASVDYEVEFCHPRLGQPAVGMRTAGRVGMPHSVALEGRRAAATSASSLQVLELKATPVTSVALEVPVQSDVLVQLLDQQMPRPDRLHALGGFAAHQSAVALACPSLQQLAFCGEVIAMVMPAAAPPAETADYQPVASTEMLQLSAALLPAQGMRVSKAAIHEIGIHPQAVTSAIPPVAESIHQMGMAGLQSLDSSLSRPAQAPLAYRAAGPLAFDLGTGVSSDVTYPRWTSVIAEDVETPPLFDRVLPLTFAKKRKAAADVARVAPIARLVPQAVEIHPVIPNSGLEPLDQKPQLDAFPKPKTAMGSLMRGERLKKAPPAWVHATGFWRHAPRDLKILLFAIPALLALYFHPGLPRIAFAAPKSSTGLTGGFTQVISNEWTNVRTTLENRAAVALDEDFRSGLDNWASPGGSTTEWSFDQTGFVRPGPLALYRPSVNLTDYQVQFLGLIDKKALSWVVRAADFDNFYVVKLEIVKSGPMPVIGLTRYAVINGKSVDRHDVNIPLDARADTVYRVRTDVQGPNFIVEVQGQIADSWTETRLPRGGVGFFTASGEASRLRWMQITHQYDMLGRLCAYLAPYDTSNGSWQP